ncbi:MAG: ATPase, T2SS/T4P/T4SS family, partial [Planctomycetota bacterium]|nr:ATPase, T2SS/T4P/T4SS family [Planctomycetota bacterium]
LRGEKRIVHCHGVFDLLHIGHIRYLGQARALGDLLVVTATPDRFVNKGPGRPAFPENLRAEAMAALDCVDYVAINDWPTASETIAELRPHIYAKGAEYRDHKTPEILKEEEAARIAKTEIAFIEDITSSSSHLINQHLSPLSEETQGFLHHIKDAHTEDEILAPLRAARPIKVIVIGETIIESYSYCQTLGNASATPVVAMQFLSEERFAGGAAGMSNFFASFCDSLQLLTQLGEVDPEEKWLSEKINKNVKAEFIHKANAPTIVRNRYRDFYYSQPIVEIYRMNKDTLTEETAGFLRACVMGRKNMLIAGGTGSGKTTTLNVLGSFILGDERIVTIEDSAELQLPQEHLARLETRPANIEGRGAYTIRDLVRNALRMRPDRLIVGEVRGPEALDMLQAMNTGHDGSLSTIHANSPADSMMRLETMVLMAADIPLSAVRRQVCDAIDLIVFIERLRGGRRMITQVSEVVDIE